MAAKPKMAPFSELESFVSKLNPFMLKITSCTFTWVDDREQESKGRKSLTYQRQNKLPAAIFSNN